MIPCRRRQLRATITRNTLRESEVEVVIDDQAFPHASWVQVMMMTQQQEVEAEG